MEGAHRMSATAWTVQLSVTTARRVEDATAAGAYGAALLVLVTEVPPRLDGPLLTDALIRTGTQPMAQQEPLGMGLPGSGRGTSALA